MSITKVWGSQLAFSRFICGKNVSMLVVNKKMLLSFTKLLKVEKKIQVKPGNFFFSFSIQTASISLKESKVEHYGSATHQEICHHMSTFLLLPSTFIRNKRINSIPQPCKCKNGQLN